MDTLKRPPGKTDGTRQAAMFGAPIEPVEQRPNQPDGSKPLSGSGTGVHYLSESANLMIFSPPCGHI